MLPFQILSKFMKFPFVTDVNYVPDPSQEHNMHANIVYHFEPMGEASHEQEYPAQPLEIMVLALTGKMKDLIDLDMLGRSITNCKMTLLRVYNNQRTNGPINAHLISGPSISI